MGGTCVWVKVGVIGREGGETRTGKVGRGTEALDCGRETRHYDTGTGRGTEQVVKKTEEKEEEENQN